ncbi:MAG: hypothetical protein HYV75_08605 [Opitutae bacterium]|nr:hypothetical protein [Opitutae bacterium]
MKSTKTKKLVLEIPLAAWNRIAKHLRKEFGIETPEEVVKDDLVDGLIATWNDSGPERWAYFYIYRDREAAQCVATRFFNEYRGGLPLTMRYKCGRRTKTEEFESPNPPAPTEVLPAGGMEVAS